MLRKVKSIFLSISLTATFLSVPLSNPAIAAVGDSDTHMTLNGTNQYAVAVDDAVFDITGAITIEAWINPTTACGSGYCTIVTKEADYIIGVNGGNYQFALWGTTWTWVDTTIKYRPNTWSHIALTRAAGVDICNIYVNGLLVSTGTAGHAGTGALGNSTYNFTIGGRTATGLSATVSELFAGKIDEVKLWTTARTQTEIQSDMNTYGPVSDTNLKLYYDMNDVSGSTLNNKQNSATSASQLTLKNSPTFDAIDTYTTSAGYTVAKFVRTYISANGWITPSWVSSMDILAVAGGGGGGNNVGGGGAGGSSYKANNQSVTAGGVVGIKVGFGGAGGRRDAARLTTYDGTDLMNGQRGDSSTVFINNQSFTGGGGGGGHTYWGNNVCGGSGGVSVWNTKGAAGGIGSQGGGGGTPSVDTNYPYYNGGNGYQDSISGTSTWYGGGGGQGYGHSLSWNGSGGSGGGGAGGSGAPGSDGTANLGGGGGGGGTACQLGGNGGSGVIFLKYSAYFSTVAISSAIFRSTSQITITTNTAGRVAFYAGGKKISNCQRVSTVGSSPITATCNWKPSQRGYVRITTVFTPSAVGASVVSSAPISIFVTSRAGAR